MIGSALGLVGVGVFGLFRLGRPPATAVGDNVPDAFGGAAKAGRTAERITTTTTTTTTTTLPPPEGLLTFPVVPVDEEQPVTVLDNFGGWSVSKQNCSHAGIDIFSPLPDGGEPLVACVDGVLSGIRINQGAQGNAWILEDANGDIYRYHHLLAFEEGLEVGMTVARGQVIGYMGESGNANWPHLHFEVRRGGTAGPAEDPLPLLDVPDEDVVVRAVNDPRCS